MNPLGQAIGQAIKQQYPKQSVNSRWEEEFARQLTEAVIYFERQYRFHPDRMWRLDFAIPSHKISIDIQGGSFGRVVVCNHCNRQVMRSRKDGAPYAVREGGGHNTGKGLKNDAEKLNALTVLGWRPLIFTPEHIKDRYAITLLAELMKQKAIPSA
jgi:hypothetical protein